jgi:hypothetical protein
MYVWGVPRLLISLVTLVGRFWFPEAANRNVAVQMRSGVWNFTGRLRVYNNDQYIVS